jgi:hypothetical protein
VAFAGGDAAAAAAHMLVRATRAPATEAGARRGVRQLAAFLAANEQLLEGVPDATADAYDFLIAVWLVARALPDRSPWRVPAEGGGRGRNPRIGGAVRAYLERMGFVRGTTWPRARATAISLGAHDADGVSHAVPVFVWELVEGLRLHGALRDVFQQCGAALLCVTALAARRRGAARGLLVGQIRPVGQQEVEIAPRSRPKQARARADGGRKERAPRPVVVRHWLVGEYVIPWLQWLRTQRFPPTAYAFPRVVRGRSAPSTTAIRRGAVFLEPAMEWTDAAIRDAMRMFIAANGDRSIQGLRSGNNIELRRAPRDVVSDVTRRTLHERSVKPLIGSEEAYDEVFAEDFVAATQRLGQLRIERSGNGLLRTVATSASAGRDPDDWQPVEGEGEEFAAEESAEGSSGVDTDDSDGSEVVGDGGSDTRRVVCGRCGLLLKARDYGFLCDHDGCTWAACGNCHPGGRAARLHCPAHQAER